MITKMFGVGDSRQEAGRQLFPSYLLVDHNLLVFHKCATPVTPGGLEPGWSSTVCCLSSCLWFLKSQIQWHNAECSASAN
jgi:hypothetical protein